MSCFYQSCNSIYVIGDEKIFPIFYVSNFAIVENKQLFWKIYSIEDKLGLSKKNHFLIEDGKLVKNFCSICSFRLRSLIKGCSSCSLSIENKEIKRTFNKEKLVESLKIIGLYEVDYTIFKKELRFLKQNKKASNI